MAGSCTSAQASARDQALSDVTFTADDNVPEGLTLKDGAIISPDVKQETRFQYHNSMKEHGVQSFVNVLILSSRGRPPFSVLQVDSREPRDFT